MSKSVNADDAIRFLNDLLATDAEAIAALFKHRVRCNAALAAHPTVQAACGPANVDVRWGQKGLAIGEFDVALLGVLNGIFGTDRQQNGFIAAEYDDDGSITRFTRTPQHEGTTP